MRVVRVGQVGGVGRLTPRQVGESGAEGAGIFCAAAATTICSNHHRGVRMSTEGHFFTAPSLSLNPTAVPSLSDFSLGFHRDRDPHGAVLLA